MFVRNVRFACFFSLVTSVLRFAFLPSPEWSYIFWQTLVTTSINFVFIHVLEMIVKMSYSFLVPFFLMSKFFLTFRSSLTSLSYSIQRIELLMHHVVVVCVFRNIFKHAILVYLYVWEMAIFYLLQWNP